MVALCPGVTGKQLATGLKTLNDRLRPLYDLHDMPFGLKNRFRWGDASMTWGGGPSDSDYFLHEQDFLSWTPNRFDSYAPPCDWSREDNAMPSAHIETWRINAQNMRRKFSAVYGADRLSDRLAAVEDLRPLRVRELRKCTPPFIRWVGGGAL